MRLEVTEDALNDLKAITRYISRDDPVAAQSVRDELWKTFRLLAEQPRIGRQRAEFTKDLRSFSQRPYLIFYRIKADEVQVLRILHAARDIPALFE